MKAAERSVRDELKRLGARRARHAAEDEAIQTATREVIAKVRSMEPDDGSISMEDAAEALGLHRSTLYEMYIDKPAAVA